MCPAFLGCGCCLNNPNENGIYSAIIYPSATYGAAMKQWTVVISFIIVLVALAGCGKKNAQEQIVIPKDAAEMSVSFSWEGIAPCEHQSPEIRVADIPDATVAFNVRLKDLTLPAWNHGGGRVANDGSGIIPAGALKIGFNGPCPPPDKRHKYEFSVMAIDDQGEIIGFGKARQLFPPKK